MYALSKQLIALSGVGTGKMPDLKGFLLHRNSIKGTNKSPAQMVELVDTQDLKSCSRKRSAGSIPALSTKNRLDSL